MQTLLPPDWAAPIGYANGIAVDAGRIVFIAGQVGWNAQQQFESEDIVPQFEQALKNVLAVLQQAGGEARHICRMTAFCCDKPAYLAALVVRRRREFKFHPQIEISKLRLAESPDGERTDGRGGK